MRFRFLTLFLFFSILFCRRLTAQEASVSPIRITTDSIFVSESGSLLSFTVQMENTSEKAFEGQLALESIAGVEWLGNASRQISLEPRSTRYYPIRLSIEETAAAGESSLRIVLLDNDGYRRAVFSSILQVILKRQVQLLNPQPVLLMQQVGDSLNVSAVVRNRGNTVERIMLTASFPEPGGAKTWLRQEVQLSPFQDTLVYFRKMLSKELLQMEYYRVNVAAFYANGEWMNNITVTVQNVASSRRFIDPQFQGYSFDSFSQNKLSLGLRDMGSSNEALQLYGGGTFQLPKGSLAFNIDGYYYTQLANRPLFSNTYLTWEHNTLGITMGNINDNMEVFVNGRGVKVYQKNPSETRRTEIAWVDKSFNLLGDRFTTGATGYTAYAKQYIKTSDHAAYTGSVLYDRSPLSDAESAILMNQYRFAPKSNIQLSFDLGGGISRPLRTDSIAFRPSLALGNAMDMRLGDYTLSGRHFYSTGYYPGTRRGMLQLQERLSRTWGGIHTWASLYVYRYAPQYFSTPYMEADFISRNMRSEGGFNFSLTRRLGLGLAARYHVENGSLWTNPLALSNGWIKSYRLGETLQWRSKNDQHNVYLNLENGWYHSVFSSAFQWQWRASASWNYRFLNVSSYWQSGDFTLAEAFNSTLQGMPDNNRFSISAGVHKTFVQNRLDLRVDMNYNKDAMLFENWTSSGNVRYAFSKKVSGFVNGYFYIYNHQYTRSQHAWMQAGITYNLPDGRHAAGKKGSIAIFLYYDINHNNVYDEGDEPAGGQLVSIGEMRFMTRPDGTISYSKVPYGEYTFQLPTARWQADVPTFIQVNQRQINWSIGLKKTNKITGFFVYTYPEKTSMPFQQRYEGLRVIVLGKDGTEYSAKTNVTGAFTLFLTAGEYQMQVDPHSLPENVYTEFAPQPIAIQADKPVRLPPIELKVKQKKVEVKRFSAP